LEPWTQIIRDSIPGVYIHATAINNLVRRDALLEIGTIGRTLSSIAMALMSAIAVLLLAPISATLAFLGLVAAWIAGGTFALRQAVALPLVEPLVAGFLTLTATTAYRFVLSDRDKRLLRNSFALYLAPSIIEKMMASNKPPMLGGETRTITVFFSDVAGFSSFSEKMSPSELVALMNEYLSAMTDIIQEHGGFVDKYIGDAITAVFGAPLDDPQHATNAVRAALRCRERLEELNQSAQAFRGHKLGHRIGLNTGDALVGNIGSRQRFNYTVMGDAVNLASRLEGANKYFATSIMAAQATVESTGSTFAWRELDSIVVQGRSEPVRIYEPLALAGMATREQTEAAQTYAKGLACWRARDFAGAAEHFARLAEVDPPAARFLARAQAFLWHPPGPDWAPINTLEGK
jgi:class 3 adenylate cyclase